MFVREAKNTSQSRKRFHLIETLESRCLLAAVPFGTNVLQPLDVSRDGSVSALDALRIINALARSENGNADPAGNVGNFIDVNADGSGTALDALRVINHLATRAPTIGVTLPNDSAPRADQAMEDGLGFDLLTNDYALTLDVSVGELAAETVQLRIGDSSATVHDITDWFVDNRATLTREQIDGFFGGPLPDGDHDIRVEIAGSSAPPIEFTISVDRETPDLLDVFPKRSVLVGDRTIEVQTVAPAGDLFLDVDSVLLVDANDASRTLRPARIDALADGSGFAVEFDEDIPAGDYEIVVDESRVATPAGNVVGDQLRRSPLSYLTPTAVWINAAGGRWSDGENWESGEVPGEHDVVLIDVPDGVVVAGPSAASTTVRHITLRGSFVSPGMIVAETISIDRGVLRIEGGGVSLDTLFTSRTGQGRIEVASSQRWLGAEFFVPVHVEAGSRMELDRGATIGSELILEGSDTDRAQLILTGIDPFLGSGSIVFAGTASRPQGNLLQANLNGRVLDSGITVGGRNGVFGGGVTYAGNVIATDGGTIAIGRISGGGEILSVDSSDGDIVLFEAEDVIVEGLGTSELLIQPFANLGYSTTDVIGSTVLGAPVLTNVTLNLPTTIRGGGVQVNERLTVNESVTLVGDADEDTAGDIVPQNVTLQFRTADIEQAPELAGAGSVLFGNAIDPPPQGFATHRIISANDRPDLIVGDGVTLGGQSGALSDIVHAGPLMTDAGALIELRRYTTSAGRIDLKPQAGRLFLQAVDAELDGIVIDGPEGAVLYTSGLSLKNPTIHVPLFVQNLPGASFRLGLVVDGDLQLNSTLTLVDQASFLALTDDDRPSNEKLSRIFGTGILVLNIFDPDPNDEVFFSGHSIESANSLTIESGITIEAGKGLIRANGLRIRGTIVDQHGQLIVRDPIVE